MKYIVTCVYLIIMSIIGCGVMVVDKRRAIKDKWRVSETSLFTIAAIGGGVGCIIGMFAMRHKTKHKKFVIGMPLLTVVTTLIIFAIVYLI